MPEEKHNESQTENTSINREFKDRIFKFIFGNEKNKSFTLSLYNAVSGKNYTSTDGLEITTLEDVLYMGMKNDLSFLISNSMNIYEHQSTYNPNIPVRMFTYSAAVYQKYIEKHIGKKIYSSTLQKLPVPKLICFYNGIEKSDDRLVLNLRDAFYSDDDTEPDIDVKVTMININYGHNQKLMDSCKPLMEYSWFTDKIRTYTKEYKTTMESGYAAEKAADRAIYEMPTDWILKPFLTEHRSEVKGMWMTEYNEQEMWDDIREAFREAYQKELDAERKRADSEKARADGEKARADNEKARADSLQAKLDAKEKSGIEVQD